MNKIFTMQGANDFVNQASDALIQNELLRAELTAIQRVLVAIVRANGGEISIKNADLLGVQSERLTARFNLDGVVLGLEEKT